MPRLVIPPNAPGPHSGRGAAGRQVGGSGPRKNAAETQRVGRCTMTRSGQVRWFGLLQGLCGDGSQGMTLPN
jgi:hypothetical protein